MKVIKINLIVFLLSTLVSSQAMAAGVMSKLGASTYIETNKPSSARLDAILHQSATSQLQNEVARARETNLARKAALERQQAELNLELDGLATEREQAISEASAVQAILTEYTGCQEYRTSRHWRNPCEQAYPGFKRIHYADIVKGREDDDVYLCTRDARPREQARCLITHILTDRCNEFRAPKSFVVPKRVQAYVKASDFFSTQKICFSIKNEISGKTVFYQRCLQENEELPLPFDADSDQHFSVVYYRHPRAHPFSFDEEFGLQLGGIYIYANQLNFDDTAVKAAQEALAIKLAKLDAREANLRRQQQEISIALKKLTS